MEQKLEPYPIEILPRPAYKKKMEVDRLLAKYPNLLVVRLVEGRVDDYLLETESGENILSDRVFKNSLANLSMNLAGGLFDTACNAHLRFLPVTKEAAEAWEGECIAPELYLGENSYALFDPCFGLCFFVRDIHNRTFPFYRHFESQEERDAYELAAGESTSEEEKGYDAHFVGVFESKKKNVLVKPRIKVHHSASKVNYWHMTLDTYRPTDRNYIRHDEKQNSADKSMFKALKQDLMQCYKINLQPEYNIVPCDYLK